MLYRFAYVLMWFTFRIFFRNINVADKDKLPNNKPVILIANHPASFLDAMVLAVFLGRPLHFYVRGDIFRHPLAYRILTWLHMIPIYSQEHGTRNLWRNQRTFERGRRLLSQNKLLLIFPEGFSRLSKQLVPLKKGAARVALQTAFGEGVSVGLVIQTVSIHYSYHGFGADLFIRVGESMDLRPYQSLFLQQPAQAINILTRDMQTLFERNVIHVQQGERTDAAESLMRMQSTRGLKGEVDFFSLARKVCEKVSSLNREEFEILSGSLSSYNTKIQQMGLKDAIPVEKDWSTPLLSFSLLLLLPFSVLGTLIWFIPGMLSKWIADKTVTRIDFYTSVHSAVMAFTGLIWWAMMLYFSFRAQGVVLAMIIFVSPVLVFMSLWWRRKLGHWQCIIKWKHLQKKDVSTFEELQGIYRYLLYY